MCLAQGHNTMTPVGDRTQDLSIRSPTLYHYATALPWPPRFIAMVRQFYDGMQARVQNDGEFSENFEVTNGVDSDTVFPIRYRFDGNIFNPIEGCKPNTMCRLMC